MSAYAETLPLASKRILTSGDVDQVKNHLCSALRPHNIHVDRRSNDLTFIHNQARIGEIALNAMYYGVEVEVKAPRSEEAYLFMLTLGGESYACQGERSVTVGRGTVYVFNPTQKMNIKLSSDHQQLILRLPRSNVERFLSRELGSSLRTPVEFETQPFKLETEVPGLQTFVQSMCLDLDAHTSGYSMQPAAKYVEHMLLSLALGSIPHNYSELYGMACAAPAPYFVRRAEEFLRANVTEPVTLQDIAQASGTSLRSLQNGFRHFRDTTPTAYLRDLRLQHVREELLQAAESNRTVTDIATSFGFMHLSKFSKYYKARYGEAPSETARRGFVS